MKKVEIGSATKFLEINKVLSARQYSKSTEDAAAFYLTKYTVNEMK